MDWSINLPTWAYNKGYRLIGGRGTYDPLELWWKTYHILRTFEPSQIPNIVELESIVKEIDEEHCYSPSL